ncbi:MAG: hypothetical protein ABSC08_01090 [Bryobacteraceae bacterium]|jgi:hypothetical protein
MKPTTFDEGTQAFGRFQGAMRRLLAVPHAEIQGREAEYKKKAALNPHKRGPKSKKSASPGPGGV